jgi:hypothetical protein
MFHCSYSFVSIFNGINSFPDKRVLAGMVVIWTCKNKSGIGIRKVILSEIQL